MCINGQFWKTHSTCHHHLYLQAAAAAFAECPLHSFPGLMPLAENSHVFVVVVVVVRLQNHPHRLLCELRFFCQLIWKNCQHFASKRQNCIVQKLHVCTSFCSFWRIKSHYGTAIDGSSWSSCGCKNKHFLKICMRAIDLNVEKLYQFDWKWTKHAEIQHTKFCFKL